MLNDKGRKRNNNVPAMKFQDRSINDSKVAGGIKKFHPPTHGQAKGNKMLIQSRDVMLHNVT